MKVFVTGHRGYIGAQLVDVLKEAGHQVTGCDLDLFAGCEWEPVTRPDRELISDVRVLTARELEGYDCVMHLAAISNDPMGELDPELTLSTNRDGSLHVARLAKEAGVERFLFAGSCSVYGNSARPAMTESDPVAPLSMYARSKIEAESRLAELAGDGFVPVLLPSAYAVGSIRIMSDGSPSRPLVHCRDIARAFLALAESPPELVSGRAINVGGNDENYRVREIADAVQQLVPEAEIVYTGEVGEDPRSYRVSFDLLGEIAPEFRLEPSLTAGLEELLAKLRQHRFSLADWEGARFVRMRTLRDRLERLTARARVA